MRFCLLIMLATTSLRTEVIDRVAITVGHEVITDLQIDEEIRVTAFLNRQPVNRSDDARRAAAARLIDQVLVRNEMELSHYPVPDAAAIDAYVEQVRSTFRPGSNFDEELESHKLTLATLRDHLAVQLTMLRFVEFRFRPESSPSGTETNTDEALNLWLEESRKQVNVVYLDKSLR